MTHHVVSIHVRKGRSAASSRARLCGLARQICARRPLVVRLAALLACNLACRTSHRMPTWLDDLNLFANACLVRLDDDNSLHCRARLSRLRAAAPVLQNSRGAFKHVADAQTDRALVAQGGDSPAVLNQPMSRCRQFSLLNRA